MVYPRRGQHPIHGANVRLTWNAVLVYLWGALAGILATHALRAFIRRRHWLAMPLAACRALPRAFAPVSSPRWSPSA